MCFRNEKKTVFKSLFHKFLVLPWSAHKYLSKCKAEGKIEELMNSLLPTRYIRTAFYR